MPNHIKHREEIDWREVDGAIMNFQIHVRKETGGNNFSYVDSTLLKKAIKDTISKVSSDSYQLGRNDVVEEVRGMIGGHEEFDSKYFTNEEKLVKGINQERSRTRQILSDISEKK